MTGRLTITAIAIASVAIAIAAGPALADDPAAGMSVVATVYATGASPVIDPTTVGPLENGCPLYEGPSLDQHGTGGAIAPAINPGAAWSIGTLISQCLATPIPLSSVTGVTILGADGAPQLDTGAQLTQADLTTPSDFLDPSESPVITDDGDGVIYERPWRGGSDANVDDVITTNAPGSFQLDVYTGTLLSVTANANATSVPVGQPVTFTASVAGSPPGLSYIWDFDGGSADATGATVTATLPEGTYDVTVEVTDADGGVGTAQVQVTVGPQQQTTTTTRMTTPGPVKSQGRTPGAPPPTTRRRTVISHRRERTTKAVSPAGAGSPVRRQSRGAPVTTVTSAAPRSVPKLVAQGAKPPASGPAAPKPLPAGVLVSGQLLSGPAPSALAVTRGQPKPAEATLDRGRGMSPLGVIVAGCAVGLLLALGAARELGYIRSAS